MNLQTVATWGQPYEAHLCRVFLAEHGIDSFIADEHMINANWLEAIALGGVRLQVRAADIAQASAIVARYRALLASEQGAQIDWGEVNPAWAEDEPDVPKAATEKAYQCARCGCERAHYEALSRRWMMLSVMLLGAPLPFLSRTWICERCGHRWREPLFKR